MVCEIEAGVTCSLLDSGRVIARAANVAALVGGAGLLLPGPFLSRVTFAMSLLCWIAGCRLSMRVTIDASLFRVLAKGDPEALGKALDEWLFRAGFRRSQQDRTLADRSRGALRLWRGQIAACAVQLATLIGAGILRFGSL